MGGEFLNKRMKLYLENEGIKQRMSCAYTPQQHGVVEQRHRQVVEMSQKYLHLLHL